jgi:type VI secretion system protein ImpM
MTVEPLSLGCYGKLPLSPEFIRYNANGLEVQALDQWFQAGIHQAKSRIGSSWSTEYLQSGPWNFLFAPEGGSHFLMGVLMPSKDRAGREFPLFLFLRLPVAPLKSRIWLAPLGADVFLRHANQQAHREWHGMELPQFRDSLDAWTIPSLDEILSAEQVYEEYLRTQTMEGFWKDLLGNFHHPVKYFLDEALRMCLEPIRKQHSKGLAWSLKFPLLESSETETFDLPYWLDLSARLMGSADVPLHLLWHRGPSKVRSCLMATFGKPLPSLVMYLIRQGQADKACYDLAPESLCEDDARLKSINPTRREVLDNGCISLDRFLSQVGEVSA